MAAQENYGTSFGNYEPQNTLMRHDAFTIYEGTPVLQQITPATAHIGNNISGYKNFDDISKKYNISHFKTKNINSLVQALF